MTQRAIITGATSGIGRALAEKLAGEGYLVGACGRRWQRLQELQQRYPNNVRIMQMDVSELESARSKFDQLVQDLGGLDLCVANAGIGRPNFDFELEPELATVAVNVVGFVATLQMAAELFIKQGRGHLVGISSVAGLFGNAGATAYNASKAFELNYLEGLYSKLRHRGVVVTDIRPGYVATELISSSKQVFWVADAEKAAQQIYAAIVRRKRYAYITRRWRLIAWAIRLMPNWIMRRFQTLS
jgi:short-subunit dehydrogenase